MFCFATLWDSGIALPLARHTGSAQAVRVLGRDGLDQWLHHAKIRAQARSLDCYGSPLHGLGPTVMLVARVDPSNIWE